MERKYEDMRSCWEFGEASECRRGLMRGMGYSLRPALMTMLGICLFRIVWVETVFRQVRTLPCLFIVFPIT